MAEKNTNPKSAALLFLHAQTPLHPGSGTALGVVDLPVQRERHTQWPLIPGSALKGILRDACREQVKGKYKSRKNANEEDPDLTAVFGPGLVDDDSAFAGALSLTDARILAFPVRSMRGVFAWVTCPAVLERFARDAAIADIEKMSLPKQKPAQNHLLCRKQSPLLLTNEQVVILEEFEFKAKDDDLAVSDWIAAHAVKDETTAGRLKECLAVLNDDDFTHFVRHATEVVARIGLDYETKTVKTGALFYEEFIPAETLFYSVALAGPSRNKKSNEMSPKSVLEYIGENLPKVLQVGADETIGKGLCAPKLMMTGGAS
jgi:CRISPR-associated protein Cmr4